MFSQWVATERRRAVAGFLRYFRPARDEFIFARVFTDKTPLYLNARASPPSAFPFVVVGGNRAEHSGDLAPADASERRVGSVKNSGIAGSIYRDVAISHLLRSRGS